MMMRTIGFSLALVLAAGAAGAQEREWTVVEQLIADLNPCAGLVTEQFGQRIGIDELEDVSLPEADISLRGDDITMSFSGTLSCRAPAGSILAGNASAAITAAAELSLADCGIDRLSVALSDFGGTFGPALMAFSPQLERVLEEEAGEVLRQGCRSFRRGRP